MLKSILQLFIPDLKTRSKGFSYKNPRRTDCAAGMGNRLVSSQVRLGCLGGFGLVAHHRVIVSCFGRTQVLDLVDSCSDERNVLHLVERGLHLVGGRPELALLGGVGNAGASCSDDGGKNELLHVTSPRLSHEWDKCYTNLPAKTQLGIHQRVKRYGTTVSTPTLTTASFRESILPVAAIAPTIIATTTPTSRLKKACRNRKNLFIIHPLWCVRT